MRQKELLLPEQAAGQLHLSDSSLTKMRCLGGGPEYLKFGRSVRYEQKAVDDWLSARRVRNTSDAARLPSRLTAAPIAGAEVPIHQVANAGPKRAQSPRRGSARENAR
jgi:hypothetical protein